MTSALHRSPTQAKREARRFNVLKAQRLQLLVALRRAVGAIDDEVSAAGGDDHPIIAAHAKVAADARALMATISACRVVPLEES